LVGVFVGVSVGVLVVASCASGAAEAFSKEPNPSVRSIVINNKVVRRNFFFIVCSSLRIMKCQAINKGDRMIYSL
jgi:hypothetical protein